VLLSGIFAAVLVTGAVWIQHAKNRVVVPTKISGVKLFEEVRDQLADNYVDTLSEARMYRMAMEGMVRELNDPYSVVLPPERLTRLNERTTGTYAGIGLQVDLRDGYVVVVSPLPGGPGEQAGILTGDRIIEIDGKAVNGWAPDEVQRLLRGAPGSKVKVTVQRGGSEAPVSFTLTRSAIHQSAVRRAAVMPGNVGYVELRVFSDSTEDELRVAIASLVRFGVRSLIIDVRANPGGLLEEGVRVSDLFLDRGQRIVSTKGRIADSNKEYDDQAPQLWPKLPIAVLVDDKTASAAELLAGALQDHDRAIIVGLPTFGKGSAQNVYPLENSGALKLTTARWYTPVGRSISKLLPSSDDGPIGQPPKPPEYKTDSGRTVVGGGGIIPDILVGDTTVSPENLAFRHALGRKVGAFHDALASFALRAKTTNAFRSPTFSITPAMLNDVYDRMLARGISIPRGTYDAASPLVSRLLSYEISRYVFGTDAEFQRKALDDKALLTAQRLLANAESQHAVFERAKQQAQQQNQRQTPAP